MRGHRRWQTLAEQMLEASPVAIVVTDRRGWITQTNGRAEALLGVDQTGDRRRLYQTSAWAITDFEGHPLPNEALPFQRVMTTLEPHYDMRHAIQWPEGRRVLLSVNAAPLFDASGAFDGIVAMLNDVTEQVEIEQARRASEERFRNIVTSIPIGLLLYTLHAGERLVLTNANPAADAILGIDCQLLLGKTIEEAFPGLARTIVPDQYRRVAAGGGVWRTDEIAYNEGQITGAYEVTAFQSSPGAVAVAFSDITARKRVEFNLEDEITRLKTYIQADNPDP
jgi:PAS domain S-box-containing protein